MRTIWICLLSLVIAGACHEARAQSPMSEDCRTVRLTPPAALAASITVTEASLNKLKSERLPAMPEAAKKELEEKINKLSEDLIDLIYKLDCFRSDLLADTLLAPPPAPPPPPSAPSSPTISSNTIFNEAVMIPDRRQWVVVSTYYATNRKTTGGTPTFAKYGGDLNQNNSDIQFGRVDVSIPTKRAPGDLNLPSLWKFEFNADPAKHFIIQSVQPIAENAAIAEMTAKLAAANSKSVLVFVHGFNVAFEDAALRSAQLAHDLAFPGLTAFFSWPSAAATKAYMRDEDAVMASESAFDKFLDRIAATGATDLYVIAHSMGNRLVTNVVRDRTLQGKSVAGLKELMLAAPDINQIVFKDQIVPAMARLQGVNATIYASASDLALAASKAIHDFARVGDTTDGVKIYSGFETIDATAAAPVTRAFGHSYIMDSPRVIADLADLIIHRKRASARALDPRETAPNNYWVLR